MILPIKLTDQSGMQVGSGVPSFVLDPMTGQPFGVDIAGTLMLVSDPTTGEPVAQADPASSPVDYSNAPGLWDSPAAGDSNAGFVPGFQSSNTAGLWDATDEAPGAALIPDTNILNTGSIRNTRGTQWTRQGSYRTESQFDKWRRAGKPTACSMRGMGDTTTADRILTAIAVGANAAAQPYYPNYSQPYYGGAQPGGSVTVSGGGNSIAWIFGGLIVVGLVVAMNKR